VRLAAARARGAFLCDPVWSLFEASLICLFFCNNNCGFRFRKGAKGWKIPNSYSPVRSFFIYFLQKACSLQLFCIFCH
jgi:hypothetical protein